jgi:hypothetical protein
MESTMNSTPEQAERNGIIAATLVEMIAANAVITDASLGAAIERTHPGLNLDADDRWRDLVDQTMPVFDAITGEAAIAESTDTMAAPLVKVAAVDLDEPLVEDPDAVLIEVHRLQMLCGDLRSQIEVATRTRGTMRGVLARAIGAWGEGARVSSENVTREYIKRAIQERADAIGRPAPPPVYMRSELDRVRKGPASTDPSSDFVRKRFVNGPARGAVKR